MLARLVAGPLVATVADRVGALRLVLASCTGLAAAAALALIWADSFLLLFAIALAQAAALAPTTSIADALSVNVARPKIAGRRFEYGWIRGSASAAFILGTLGVGQLISPPDYSVIAWANAALLITAAGATALVPGAAGRAARQPVPSSLVLDLGALLAIPRFRAVILVSALVYGSHAMHDAFAAIRWTDAGMSPSAVSFLWSEAVIAEVFVFLFIGPAFLDRFGARDAAILSAGAGILRWCVAGLTTSTWALALIQPLHGLTFALLHLACMRIFGDLIPRSAAATAQAFYALGSGLMTAALTFLSGALYASYTGAGFFAMAVLCALALPVASLGLADTSDGSIAGM